MTNHCLAGRFDPNDPLPEATYDAEVLAAQTKVLGASHRDTLATPPAAPHRRALLKRPRYSPSMVLFTADSQ